MKTIPLQQPTDLLRRNVTFNKKVVFGTAQQLRSFLCKLPNWMEDDDIDANTTLLKWVDLTGQTALNTYYFDFFIDEIKLLQQQKPDTLKEIHSAIVELFNHMLKHELPMHQCTHLASYQQRKQRANLSKANLQFAKLEDAKNLDLTGAIVD